MTQTGLRSIARSLDALADLPGIRGFMNAGVELVAEVLEARVVALLLLDEGGRDLIVRASLSSDRGAAGPTVPDAGPAVGDRHRVEDSIPGWVVQTSEHLAVRSVEDDRRFAPTRHPILERGSALCVPLAFEGHVVGALFAGAPRSAGTFHEGDLAVLGALSRRIGMVLERLRAAGPSADPATIVAAIHAVVRARRAARSGTSRVARIAMELGRRLGIGGEDLEALAYAARVHDVGMAALGDNLLDRPTRLTEHELSRVAEHPRTGVAMLGPFEFTTRVQEIVLAHHEHWDGSGYPQGLREQEIPLAARIVAVLDAYESQVTGRPYRPAVTEDEALAEIRRCAGTQFDPKVVAALEQVLAAEPSPRADPGRGVGAGR